MEGGAVGRMEGVQVKLRFYFLIIIFLVLSPGLRSPDPKALIFPMLFLGVRQWPTAGDPAVNTVTDSTGLARGWGLVLAARVPETALSGKNQEERKKTQVPLGFPSND